MIIIRSESDLKTFLARSRVAPTADHAKQLQHVEQNPHTEERSTSVNSAARNGGETTARKQRSPLKGHGDKSYRNLA
jgi:hypothetical protein